MALQIVETARTLLQEGKTAEERQLRVALDRACNLFEVGPDKQQWRVTARPPKGREGHNWQLRYFPPPGEGRPGKEGKPYQRSAKTRDGDEAWSRARAEEARLNGTSLPLEEAMRAHLDHLLATSAKKNTVAALRVAINRVAGHVTNPTRGSLTRYQDMLLGQGLKAKTINNYLRWCASSWTWALERELVDQPWPRVKDLPEKTTDLRPCTPEETLALLRYFDGREGKWSWEGPYFALLAAAGSRVSETMRLRFEDLDRDTGEVRFRSEETKTSVSRLAVVPPEVLARLEGDCGEVWPDLRYWDVRRAWGRALKACGLEGEKIRPHSMRRAWITDQLEAGTPLNHVMAQAGHTSPKTTLGYEANATRRDLARSSRRLADYRRANPHTSPTGLWGAPVESQATEGGPRGHNRDVYCSTEVDPRDQTQVPQGFQPELPPGVTPTVGAALIEALRTSKPLRAWLLAALDELD